MKMVEATILVPLTILIIASIIGLMLRYYSDLEHSIERHESQRKEIYSETVW